MALYSAALDEIEAEFRRLTIERRELAALLRRHNRLPERTQRLPGRGSDAAQARPNTPHAPSMPPLREAVLATIGLRPRSYKPGELAQEMQRQGYSADEDLARLSSQVGTELVHLHQHGLVSKDPVTARYKANAFEPDSAAPTHTTSAVVYEGWNRDAEPMIEILDDSLSLRGHRRS